MKQPEPVTQVKRRRDLALSVIVSQVPYIKFLGVSFDRHGDELTSTMAFHEDLIGNPMLPALHGGATAAFLEVTAIVGLAWASLWTDIEEERLCSCASEPLRTALRLGACRGLARQPKSPFCSGYRSLFDATTRWLKII